MIASTNGLPGGDRFADSLLALRERKKVLDASWLLTLVVLFIAIAIPWFLRVFEVDLGRAAWSLFGFAIFYVGGALAVDRLTSRRALLLGIGLLHGAGIVFLGALWLLVGGLQAPLFLLVFVLPVVATGVMMLGWQAYAAAALSIAVVVTAALVSTPALRWYLIQLGLPWAGMLERLPQSLPGSTPFPGSEIRPAYVVVLLDFFGILLFATAVTTESVATLLLRLYARLQSSAEALSRAEQLSQHVLKAAPDPAALVYRDNYQVVEASDSFFRKLLLDRADLPNKTLFDLIAFSHPEVVEGTLSGPGGEIPFAVHRIGSETRVSRINIYPIRHGATEYVHVSLHDVSDLYYLKRSLDAVDDPQLLIGANRRLLYFNRAARELLPRIYLGADAVAVLEVTGVPTGWWDPGPRLKHERRIVIDGSSLEVHLATVELPGEPGRFTVLTLRKEPRS